MEIENIELLTQQELDMIGALESFKLPITESLAFDISKIAKPLGTTRIIVEQRKNPERTETIRLQISQIHDIEHRLEVCVGERITAERTHQIKDITINKLHRILEHETDFSRKLEIAQTRLNHIQNESSMSSVFHRPSRYKYVRQSPEIKNVIDKLSLSQEKLSEAHSVYLKESNDLLKQYAKLLGKDLEDLDALECQVTYWRNQEGYWRQLLEEFKQCNNPAGIGINHTVDTLGEYVQSEDCIKLYIDTISSYGRNTALFFTLIHELFHAFYCKSTRKEIDEAMVEFSVLIYLASARKSMEQVKDIDAIFDAALRNVKGKQLSCGSLPSYGFGAYLFEKCKNPFDWMLQYSKFGLTEDKNKYVQSYIGDLNPLYTPQEAKTYSTLHKILFDTWPTPEKSGPDKEPDKCSRESEDKITPDEITIWDRECFR